MCNILRFQGRRGGSENASAGPKLLGEPVLDPQKVIQQNENKELCLGGNGRVKPLYGPKELNQNTRASSLRGSVSVYPW